MKDVFGKDFAKILEKHGWQLKRINGSHHIYARPDTIMRISVPIHGNKSLKIGLLRNLMKIAGINENDF